MSLARRKRLQVLLPDQEMAEIRRLAESERLTVGECVRRSLRQARESKPLRPSAVRLQAVRRASELSFPVSDIRQMIEEIERGCQG